VLASGLPFYLGIVNRRRSASTVSAKVLLIAKLPIQIILIFLSFIGFNAVALLYREYRLNSEIRSSGRSDKKLVSMKEELLCLSQEKYSGCFFESVLSFGVVSYCMISGTVSQHKDISKPSSYEYLCWISSFIAIFYKNSQIWQLSEERERFNRWKLERCEENSKTGTCDDDSKIMVRERPILDAESTPIEDSDKENSYQEELHAGSTPIENSDKDNSFQESLQELPEGCLTKFHKAAVLVFDL